VKLRIQWKEFTVLVLSASLLAATSSWAVLHDIHGQSEAQVLPTRLGMQPMTCSQQESGILGTIGRLATGHSIGQLASQGVIGDPLFVAGRAQIDRAGQGASSSDANTLVVLHSTASRAPSPLNSVRGNATLQSVGVVHLQSDDPALRSCDRRVADSPQAQALVKRAAASMVNAGLVTQQQLDNASTTYYVSDDPMSPGNEFVTAVLAQGTPMEKGERSTGTALPASQLLTPVVASVNRVTGSVTDVGYANWYAGE